MHEKRTRTVPYAKAFRIHLNQENEYQVQYIKGMTSLLSFISSLTDNLKTYNTASKRKYSGLSKYGCMLLSCHVLILQRIYTLQLPQCQETPCSKQARYLKFK